MVVAHNPGDRLVQLCAALSGQAPVLIVDNASTEGKEVLELCVSRGAELLRLDANEGVAGGLRAGLGHFHERDWILTFDQDSVVEPQFLSDMASYPMLSDPRVAMLGPVVVDADSGEVLQPASAGDARFVITSGALCRVQALVDIGGFRRDLFIDHVDHDVCLRLRQRGWRLRITDTVVMRHSIGHMRNHQVGPLIVRNSHHSADRQYYKYRNYVLLVRDGTAKMDPRWMARVGAALAWGPVKILLFEENKAIKVSSAIAGLLDGLRGRVGPRGRSQSPAPQRPAIALGPRALVISAPFFGYYKHIINGLEGRGYQVDYFNDRPSENPFLKAAIKLRPRLADSIVEAYLRRTLRRTSGRDYELILVMNGKALTPAFVQRLVQDNPRARSVLYLWDAIKLYPHVLELARHFDRLFTFDAEDVRTHRDFSLLPLFYTDDHRAVGESEVVSARYDIINVCTAHPNRYALMKNWIPQLRAEGLAVFSYLYLNPLQFLYNKMTLPVFADAKPSEFQFSPLATGKHLDLLRSARAALDVNHSDQTGLTMRTIETMGARRKLITTNTEVMKYAFYHPSRVLVVEGAQIPRGLVKQFLAIPQEPLDEATYELFGLQAWLTEIMTGDGSRHESVLDK